MGGHIYSSSYNYFISIPGSKVLSILTALPATYLFHYYQKSQVESKPRSSDTYAESWLTVHRNQKIKWHFRIPHLLIIQTDQEKEVFDVTIAKNEKPDSVTWIFHKVPHRIKKIFLYLFHTSWMNSALQLLCCAVMIIFTDFRMSYLESFITPQLM